MADYDFWWGMIELQTEHKGSAEGIGYYVKPYAYYKNGFDKMRS